MISIMGYVMKNNNDYEEELLKNIEIKKNYKNLDRLEKGKLIKKLINISINIDDFRFLNAALKIYDSLDAKNIDNNLIEIKNNALNYVRGKVLRLNKNENNFNN